MGPGLAYLAYELVRRNKKRSFRQYLRDKLYGRDVPSVLAPNSLDLGIGTLNSIIGADDVKWHAEDAASARTNARDQRQTLRNIHNIKKTVGDTEKMAPGLKSTSKYYIDTDKMHLKNRVDHAKWKALTSGRTLAGHLGNFLLGAGTSYGVRSVLNGLIRPFLNR